MCHSFGGHPGTGTFSSGMSEKLPWSATYIPWSGSRFTSMAIPSESPDAVWNDLRYIPTQTKHNWLHGPGTVAPFKLHKDSKTITTPRYQAIGPPFQ